MFLALHVPSIDTEFVRDSCDALASYNARTYRCAPGEACTRSPWHLQYLPSAGDSRVSCDGEPMLVMRDAVTLMRHGAGACGELTAAYVGWLRAHGLLASVRVIEVSDDSWHVVAVVGGSIIDPARPEHLHAWRRAYGVR